MVEALSNHPVGSYKNPRVVTPQELHDVIINNLEGQMQGEIVSLLGKSMDEGLTEDEVLGVFERAVHGAYDWFKKD